MWPLIYIYIFVFSFGLSVILTMSMIGIARRFNILDRPEGRKVHSVSTPLLGGLAIFLAFNLTIIINLSLLFLFKTSRLFPHELGQYLSGINSTKMQLFTILFVGFLVMMIGLVDDLKKLSPFYKLILEICLALVLYFAGIKITLFIRNEIVSAVLTVGWIVGITNAFNLLDNIDGLSCGVAAIAGVIFFIIAAGGGQYFVSCITIAFTAIMLGFLVFNFPPAKIFMGDAGSLYLGYILGVLTIIETFYTRHLPTTLPVIMPLLILAVPLFDTISVLYIRIKNHRPVYTGDRNHFSHRLLRLGMNTKQTVLFIYLLTFLLGIGAILLKGLTVLPSLILLIQSIGIIFIIVILENIKTK
ncbi:MAG: MraY family glycosyltransferase [Candidatus Omnitrophota bacterium]